MSKEQINQKIVEIEGQINNVHGTECEVYSRIVGYYRSVKNWNAGKSEEYKQRINYSCP